MKFKASNRINQRIERISPNHLVIGIDIAKETHVAAAVNFRGTQHGRVLSFSNDSFGIEKLLHWVHDLQQARGLPEVIFAAEATGHYFLNVAFALRERGYTVVLVNPLTTKRNKENRDNRPSKNDAKDALTIADVTSRGFYSDWVVHETVYRQLHCTVNEREALSTDLAAIGNQIQSALDRVFPEFRTIFTEWDGVRALATLKSFPLPSQIRGLEVSEIVAAWKKAGMTRPGGLLGIRIATQLRETARRSIGITDVAEEIKRCLERLLARYDALRAQIVELDREVEARLREIPDEVLRPLQEVGMPVLFTAVILANTGDLRRYKHGQQVIALAGLNLAERTSGTHKGQIKLSKRGRRQLRKYLYLAVLMLVCNHPVFRRWHTHNVKTLRMKGRNSLFKLIGKLMRILVAMAHTGEGFDDNKHSKLGQVA